MREASELKETILRVASELFSWRGYAATSIKQIAKAAGCTTAALYYYFEEGKVHILREVVRLYSKDVLSAVDEEAEFTDLAAYLGALARRIGQSMHQRSRRMNWLLLEVRSLPLKEQERFREQFQKQFQGLHRAIRTRLERYVDDLEQANMLAWIIVCAFLGYGQLFEVMGLKDRLAPSLDAFGHALMAMIGQAG